MLTVKKIALALIVDGLLVQIPQVVKQRPYMSKIYRAMAKKNISLSMHHKDKFEDAYQLAEATGRAVVATGKDYASISKAVQVIIQREPWLIKYYKLNVKHLQKMYDAFYSDEIIFRSSQFASAVINCLETEHAHYQFNKDK